MMEQVNFYMLPIAALIPLILGYVWYHPAVFGNRLAKNIGQSPDQIGTFGSFKKIGFVYLFSLLLSYIILLLSVHQLGAHLLFLGERQMEDPNYGAHAFLANFMEQYGERHRTFGHGVLHGLETGLFVSLALIGATTIIEGRPLKQVWPHIGFWVLCSALIGGVLAAFF